MSKNTDENLKDLLELLQNSLISKERKKFWWSKIESKDISEEEFEEMVAELDAAITEGENEIRRMDEEIKRKEGKIDEMSKEETKMANELYPGALEEMDEEVAEFKQEVNEIDKRAVDQIEGVAKEGEKEEMADIYEKLKKPKK